MQSILVVGTARSGTSMTCGVLECLNVSILAAKSTAKQLIHNPKGAYELPNIMELGNYLNSVEPVGKEHEIKEYLLKNLFHDLPNNMWGFKTPTPRLKGIKFLLDLMPNPHVIIIFRNIVDQAKSFQAFLEKLNEPQRPFHDLLHEMAENNLQLQEVYSELVQKSIPVEAISYKNLKSKPLKVARRLAEFLNISYLDEFDEKINQFIDPNLQTWKEEHLKVISPVEV